MAGLVPAIHAAARKSESIVGAARSKSLQMQRFLASVANLRALDAPNRVDGRAKPGHDAKPARDLSDAPN
jgi:hypothetical protein